MPKRKQTFNKAAIKREIAQFLASNQPVESQPSVPISGIKSAEMSKPTAAPTIADSSTAVWSTTTVAELKKIAFLIAVAFIILGSLVVIDRKTPAVATFGQRIIHLFGL